MLRFEQKVLALPEWLKKEMPPLLSLHPSVEDFGTHGAISADRAEEPGAHELLSAPRLIETVSSTGVPRVGAISSHQFTLPETTTLREALQFKTENKDFNEKFFQSMDGRVLNPDLQTLGQANFLFTTLSVKRDDLDKKNFVVKWSVKTGGEYKTVDGKVKSDPAQFGSRIVGDTQIAKCCDHSKETCTYYNAQYHASGADGMTRDGDIIMVSPGTKTKGINDLDDGQRNRQIGDYMSSWSEAWGYKATSYEEKCATWSKAGQVAIARLEGKLDRRKDVHTEEPWPESVYRMKDNVDEQGKPGSGLDEVTIYTHGKGVPWTHIRIEERPQYPVIEDHPEHPV